MIDATLHAPFEGVWRLTQGWGSNSKLYAQFRYDSRSFSAWTQRFGFRLAHRHGHPCCDAGKVLWVGFEEGGFGNYVQLMHSWGESLYVHLGTVPMLGMYGHVKAEGEFIGRSGNSGACIKSKWGNGAHLHFGIRLNPYKRNNVWIGATL